MLAEAQRDRLRVVLVAARNPLNIGAAARAMSNFGFAHLRVVNPYGPSFREARSAVGAAEVVAQSEQYASVADAIADCSLVVGTSAIHHRDPAHRVEELAAGMRDMRAHLRSGRAALLFGSEKRGLSNDDLSYCQWLIHIPTREAHRSMNLGQAVAICLYELARSNVAGRRAGRREGTAAEHLERITALLVDILEASGYFRKNQQGEIRLRRFVRRLDLNGEDAELLLGMLRQIAWKVKKRLPL